MSEPKVLRERIKELFFTFAEREREPKTIYVTDLTGCLRAAFYELYFRANPLPTPPMVLGRLLHAVLKDVFVKEFANAEYEKRCEYVLGEGWKLVGRADVVTGDAVYEFKFTRGLGFNKAEPAYAAQVSAYCFMLGKSVGYLVDVDRDTFDVQVLEVKPDEDLWKNMLNEANVLIDNVRKGEPPTLNSPRFGFECKQCAWRIVCDIGREVMKGGSVQ